MKGILIDPYTETITEVEYHGDYKEIYILLSDVSRQVDCFTVIQVDEHESLFVDDESLLHRPTHFFAWKGYGQPLAGKGLILGSDDEGDSVATKYTLDYVKSRVAWANHLEFSHMEHFQDTIDHPLLGPNTPRFGNTPVFIKKR